MPPPYTAQFRIDQPVGGGPGSPGIARIDLWRTLRVNLTPTNPPPGATFHWEMVRPRGSAATFLAPDGVSPGENHQTPHFYPDLWGSYLIQLSINNGLYTFRLIAAIKFDSSGALMKLGWRYPALDEGWLDASDEMGWKKPIEEIFDSLLGMMESLQGSGGHSGDDGGETRAADTAVQVERRTRIREQSLTISQDDSAYELLGILDQKQLGQMVAQLAFCTRDSGGGPDPGYGLAVVDPADESVMFIVPLTWWLVPGVLESLLPMSLVTFGTQAAVVSDNCIVVLELGAQLASRTYSEPDAAILVNPDVGGGFGSECRVAFGVDRGAPRIFITDKVRQKIYTAQVNLPAPLATGVFLP